jgi:opacity protein-like surface antigen
VPRRLLALAVTALALVSSAGCADDVSPAARIGDTKIGNGAFLDEVAEWAGSDTLVAALQIPSTEGGGPGSYSISFADFVLSNRINFELHNAKFEELGLELSAQELNDVRDALLGDPAATEAVLAELSKSYGDHLVADVARQAAVGQSLGDGYEAWLAEAFAKADIEVSPRYGTWDRASNQIVPPEGPVQPAGVFTPTGL